MSPIAFLNAVLPFSVPRASGDEPETEAEKSERILCSPRERG